MNHDAEPFEKRLKRLPLRQIPRDWRNEILSAAGETQPIPRTAVVSNDSFLSKLNRRLVSLLWPHPVAWGAMAAIWVLILAVNFSIRDEAPVVAGKDATPSPEVLAELRAQHRLYTELIGANPSDSSDADRQKTFVPKSQSERIERMTA